MEIIEELLQNKPLVFGIIGALVAAIILVGYLIYREKKKDQEEIDDIMSSLVEPKRKPITEIEEDDEEEVVQDEKNVLVQEISEEQKEEKQDIETEAKTLDIEAMLERMQQDLNTKAEDVVATFEQEQEENSIISYQELVRSLKGEKIEKTPVKIEDVVSEEPVKLEQLSMDIEDVEEEQYSKKFQKTDFISPVYGKMNEKLEYPTVPQFNKNDKEIEKELETYESKVESNLVNKNIDDFLGDFEFDNNIEVNSLEQTLNMKPLSEEIKKNDDFLKALKDFRKNLD